MSKSDLATFKLVVVSPDKVIFEGLSTRLMAPGISQELAILPDHTPLYSQLKPGSLTVYLPSGATRTLPLEGGILRVKQNEVSVVIGFDLIGRS